MDNLFFATGHLPEKSGRMPLNALVIPRQLPLQCHLFGASENTLKTDRVVPESPIDYHRNQ